MTKHTYLLTILCFFSLIGPALAQNTLDMRFFSKLPIQHDGRIKPMESFARHLNAKLQSNPNLENQTAIYFIAEAFFDPAKFSVKPLFDVSDSKLKQTLGLNGKQPLFSLSVIIPLLQKKRSFLEKILEKNPNEWNETEKKLYDLYETASLLKSVMTSFQIFLPLKIPLPERLISELNIPASDAETYLTFKKHEERFKTYLQKQPPEQIREDVKAFLFQITAIEQNTDRQNFVRILPPEWPLNTSDEWNSPWILINTGLSGPESAAYISQWERMAAAYRDNSPAEWRQASQSALNHALEFKNIDTTKNKLNLEVTYLTLNPYFFTLIFYALTLGICLIAFMKPELPLSILGLTTLISGSLFQMIAIIMRIIILERPPVSTLFESILFVSLICVATSLIMAILRKDKTFLIFIGALLGILFYYLGAYFAKSGDTLQVLTAVLDTSFWLGTHVIIITAGYGLCAITAMVAHFYLFKCVFNDNNASYLVPLTLKLALASLLLTTVGTILGGIWADQSWGRFWGWDPKENGALLIVLWLIWAIHGKIAGQLKDLGFMACIALLNIIVALAWFGVNLLNVGLHSYGFINGIAYGLSAFCIAEIVLIAVLTYISIRKFKHEA